MCIFSEKLNFVAFPTQLSTSFRIIFTEWCEVKVSVWRRGHFGPQIYPEPSFEKAILSAQMCSSSGWINTVLSEVVKVCHSQGDHILSLELSCY